MEFALEMGYLHFVRPVIFTSLNAIEVFLWRGLKKEAGDGFVPAFQLDETGKKDAGQLLWKYLQDGGDIGYLTTAILDAFTTSGPFRKVSPNERKNEDEPKNSMT